VQASFAGISGLMQLGDTSTWSDRSWCATGCSCDVQFHRRTSHLGSQADGSSGNPTTINHRDVGGITTGSEAATEEIPNPGGAKPKHRSSLFGSQQEGLRARAARLREAWGDSAERRECADQRGREFQAATLGLQAKIAESWERRQSPGGLLPAAGYGAGGIRVGAAERGAGGWAGRTGFDAEAVARRFSADYTTEWERAVLRRAPGRADAGSAANSPATGVSFSSGGGPGFGAEQRAHLGTADCRPGKRTRMTLKSGMPGFSDEGDIGSAMKQC